MVIGKQYMVIGFLIEQVVKDELSKKKWFIKLPYVDGTHQPNSLPPQTKLVIKFLDGHKKGSKLQFN